MNTINWIKPFCFCLLLLIPCIGYSAQAPWVGDSLKDAPCRGNGQGVGPWDYTLRAKSPKELKVVEDYHFSSNVERLIKGDTASIGHDLDYTLRAWPNHHRALNSISRYQLRNQGKNVLNSPVECYFQRALNFSKEDGTTYMLYGIYLHRSGHLNKAREEYQNAEKFIPNNSGLLYNFGLLLVDMESYQAAKEYAKKAYQAGYPLPGLRKKLQKAGYWP